MFGPPGRLYVYFTYGNHWMMNVVTRRDGDPSAVLLRAARPVEGLAEMARRRGRERDIELGSGPGKLCQAMDVDRGLDGEDLVRGRTDLARGGVAGRSRRRSSPGSAWASAPGSTIRGGSGSRTTRSCRRAVRGPLGAQGAKR